MTSLPFPSVRRRTDAFALVLTLLILSVLAIVAVSYLASMSAERGTAAAFANKARAEEAARAGADSAMATLREHLRAFPDSVTVWDPGQSINADNTYNEGTTLYLRAQGASTDPADPENRPNPDATSPDNRPTSLVAGTADTRLTFALPLVSGVLDDPAISTVHSPARLLPFKLQALPVLGDLDANGKPSDNFADLNVRRFRGDTQGWIGSPPTGAGPTPVTAPIPPPPKSVRAPWVELKTPRLDDPTKLSTTARYAFWMEDESFRVNVSRAGFRDKDARRDNAKEQALNAADINLRGTLNATLQANAADSFGQAIVDARGIFPGGLFPVPRAYTHTGSDGGTTLPVALDDSLRYLTTVSSSALNFSRHGSLRLNLKDAQRVLDPKLDPDPGIAANVSKMQQEVDRLVETIRFHAPNFGERFYRLSTATDPATLNALQVKDNRTVVSNNTTGSALHRNIYLYKVAANLRDYLDEDAQPTMIKLDGSIYVPGPPESANTPTPGNPPRLQVGFGDYGENRIAAMGKEAVPFIQEGGIRIQGSVANGSYSLTLDYYVELWNMTDRPLQVANKPGSSTVDDPNVYLGADTYLRIANQPGWLQDVTGNINNNNSTFPALTTTDPDKIPPTEAPLLYGAANARDYNIDLSTAQRGPARTPGPVTFDPGVATVITTDPNWASSGAVANGANVFYCPNLIGPKDPATGVQYAGKRDYKGKLDKRLSDQQQADAIKLLFRPLEAADPKKPAGTNRSDYLTEVILGNSRGYLECFQQPIPIYNGGNVIDYRDKVAPVTRFNAGSLMGNNNAASQLGDPRTNNEQLYFTPYDPGSIGEPGQTRYFNETNAAQLTFGNPNYYLNPANNPAFRPNGSAGIPWPDYWDYPSGKGNPTAATTPAVVANGPLTSIGQLGDLFDPARVQSGGNIGIKGSRGGGRTFRIGQHDDLLDVSANAGSFPVSREWTAWRLTDFFATSGVVSQPGLINVNGLARDNGAALLAALNGFKFQLLTDTNPKTMDPMIHGDTNTSGKSLDATLPAVIKNIVETRFRKPGSGNPSPDPAKPGPYFERGEISESLVPPTTTFPPPPSLNTGGFAQVFDRGREEVFRRIAEMITTRGDVFTAYVMAQAGQTAITPGAKFVPTATALLKVTFQLVPKDKSGNDFDPGSVPFTFAHGDVAATQAAVAKRFASPDHYDIKVLQASSTRDP